MLVFKCSVIFRIALNFFLYFDFLGLGAALLLVVLCVGGEAALCKYMN